MKFEQLFRNVILEGEDDDFFSIKQVNSALKRSFREKAPELFGVEEVEDVEESRVGGDDKDDFIPAVKVDGHLITAPWITRSRDVGSTTTLTYAIVSGQSSRLMTIWQRPYDDVNIESFDVDKAISDVHKSYGDSK